MNAIFAVTSGGWFGLGGGMPWPHSSADMKRFKETTTGCTVVMGASTWSSDMPKPLPNRRNIVLSTQLDDSRCEVYRNVTHLLMNLGDSEQVWVIGGAKVLWSLRPYINRVHLTVFNDGVVGDVHLDYEKYLDGFNLSSTQDFGNHKLEVWCKE